MLFRTACDHCRNPIELSQVQQGKRIVCSHCRAEFVAYPVASIEEPPIELEDLEPEMQPALALETDGGATAGKNSLAVPPPPDEDWNESKEEELDLLPGQKFPYFRPRRKHLEPFLDPDFGDDHSGFYLAGIVGFAVLLALIFFVLILFFVL